jgi:hypothetical protein
MGEAAALNQIVQRALANLQPSLQLLTRQQLFTSGVNVFTEMSHDGILS